MNGIRHIRRGAGVLAGLEGSCWHSAPPPRSPVSRFRVRAEQRATPRPYSPPRPAPSPWSPAAVCPAGRSPSSPSVLPCSQPLSQYSWTGHEPPAATRSPQPPEPCPPDKRRRPAVRRRSGFLWRGRGGGAVHAVRVMRSRGPRPRADRGGGGAGAGRGRAAGRPLGVAQSAGPADFGSIPGRAGGAQGWMIASVPAAATPPQHLMDRRVRPRRDEPATSQRIAAPPRRSAGAHHRRICLYRTDRYGKHGNVQLAVRGLVNIRQGGAVRGERTFTPRDINRIRMTATAARKILHRACQTGETLLFTL
jgi:hypothetical protein